MLLTSGLWILYDLLLSGKTFKILEEKYLVSVISSVCSAVRWRAENCFAQGSRAAWCVLWDCAAVTHILTALKNKKDKVMGRGWENGVQSISYVWNHLLLHVFLLLAT
jgi:hypothetical protein